MTAILTLSDGRTFDKLSDALAISYAKALASTMEISDGHVCVILSDGSCIVVSPDGEGRYVIGRLRYRNGGVRC